MGGYRVPYASRERYQTPRNSIAALMMRQGEIAGEGATRNAAIWADVLTRLGALPAQIQQGKLAAEEAKAIKDERAARTEERKAKTAADQQQRRTQTEASGALAGYATEGFDFEGAVSRLPPDSQLVARKMFEEMEGSRLKTKEMRDKADSRDAFDMARLAGAAEELMNSPLAEAGLGIISQYAAGRFSKQMAAINEAIKKDPNSLGPLLKSLQQASPEYLKLRAETGPQYGEASPGTTVYDKRTGATKFTTPPDPDKAADNARQEKTLANTIAHQQATLIETRRHHRAMENKPTAPQRLTKDERQDMAAWDYALPKLDKFVAYVDKNPDKWGKFDAFKEAIKQALPGLGDAEYASQAAFIGRVNAEIKHAIYGASLTEGEKEDAKTFLIDASMQPVEIVSKVREAAERGRANVQYYRDLGFQLPGQGAATGGGDWQSVGGFRVREKK